MIQNTNRILAEVNKSNYIGTNVPGIEELGNDSQLKMIDDGIYELVVNYHFEDIDLDSLHSGDDISGTIGKVGKTR